MNPKSPVLICHGCKPEFRFDGDAYDALYLPSRPLIAVRAHDAIILPDHPVIRDYVDFLSEVGLLHLGQILWTSNTNYLLDEDILLELIDAVTNLTSDGNWAIAPYSVTAEFDLWAKKIPGVQTMGDNSKWVKTYSTKAFLHSSFWPHPGLDQPLISAIPGINVARGYACYSEGELIGAFHDLQSEGIDECIIKPTVGTTGEGMFFVRSENALRGYSFPMGPVVIEEKLEVDLDCSGRQLAPSIQFVGSKLSHQVTDQIVHGCAYAGNIVPSCMPRQFQEEMMTMARAIIHAIHPKGPGGLDFLAVSGQPVLVDPNLGRITAAIPAITFRNNHAPGACFKTWKIDPPKENVRDFWRKLQERGIAFELGKNHAGVFPTGFLSNIWGTLIAIGTSREELDRLSHQAAECLQY